MDDTPVRRARPTDPEIQVQIVLVIEELQVQVRDIKENELHRIKAQGNTSVYQDFSSISSPKCRLAGTILV
jgi:hypothetical protein